MVLTMLFPGESEDSYFFLDNFRYFGVKYISIQERDEGSKYEMCAENTGFSGPFCVSGVFEHI